MWKNYCTVGDHTGIHIYTVDVAYPTYWRILSATCPAHLVSCVMAIWLSSYSVHPVIHGIFWVRWVMQVHTLRSSNVDCRRVSHSGDATPRNTLLHHWPPPQWWNTPLIHFHGWFRNGWVCKLQELRGKSAGNLHVQGETAKGHKKALCPVKFPPNNPITKKQWVIPSPSPSSRGLSPSDFHMSRVLKVSNSKSLNPLQSCWCWLVISILFLCIFIPDHMGLSENNIPAILIDYHHVPF